MARCGTGRRFADQIPGVQGLSRMAYYTYFCKLLDMLLNRFKYENVPDTLDIRYLELTLVTEGQAVIFNDPEIGLCGFGATYEGTIDQYGVPINRQAISANGVSFAELNPGNSVIMFNNRLRMGDIQTVIEYARRLYEVQRTIDCNIKMQKMSGLVITDEKQRLTMKNAIAKWDGDEPIIFAGNGFNKDAFASIDFDIPFVAKDLMDAKNRILNEFLTFMGIVNTNSDKRERMIVTEASAPFGQIELARKSYLNERVKAIEEVNRLFGTEITVDFDSEIPLVAIDAREGESYE